MQPILEMRHLTEFSNTNSSFSQSWTIQYTFKTIAKILTKFYDHSCSVLQYKKCKICDNFTTSFCFQMRVILYTNHEDAAAIITNRND